MQAENEDVVNRVWRPVFSMNTPAVAREAVPLIARRLKADPAIELASARRLCMLVAELAKDQESRAELGPELIEPCVQLVARATDSKDQATRFQALRALGNMCFDHDENRHRVLDCHGVAVILESINVFQRDLEGEESELQDARTATSAVLLNLGLDNDRMQKELIDCGVMESLAWLLQRSVSGSEADMVLRAISVFQDDDGALATFCAKGGLRGVVNQLLVLPAEDPVPEELTALLRVVAKSDALLRHLSQDNVAVDLLKLSEKPHLELAGLCAILISVGLGDDTCLSLLLDPEHRDRLFKCVMQWLAEVDQSDNYELPAAGALAVGNIVRSDENSRTMAAVPGVMEALIHMLAKDRMGFQYNALGALKNLIRLPVNKEKCVELGLIPAVSTALQSDGGPVQYRAASLIRALCLDPNATDVIAQLVVIDGVIARLVHLGHQEDEHVRAEATRALGNFVKNCGSVTVMQQVVDANAVTNMISLLDSRFPTLQSEMLVALVMLAVQLPSAAPTLCAAGARDRAQAIIDTSAIPQLRANAESLVTALRAAVPAQ